MLCMRIVNDQEKKVKTQIIWIFLDASLTSHEIVN